MRVVSNYKRMPILPSALREAEMRGRLLFGIQIVVQMDRALNVEVPEMHSDVLPLLKKRIGRG
jgi:hypothetical protein